MRRSPSSVLGGARDDAALRRSLSRRRARPRLRAGEHRPPDDEAPAARARRVLPARITHMSSCSERSVAAIVATLVACAERAAARCRRRAACTADRAGRAGARNRRRRRRPPPPAMLTRERSRWVAGDVGPSCRAGTRDRTRELWPALLRGCERPAPAWTALCAEARAAAPTDDAAARALARCSALQPYRVEALDGRAEGLVTGYFEPLVDAIARTARRVPRAAARAAGRPGDPQAVLDARSRSKRVPAAHGGVARPRDRLRRRPARCAARCRSRARGGCADRAGRLARNWCASRSPATTTSRTDRSAAG